MCVCVCVCVCVIGSVLSFFGAVHPSALCLVSRCRNLLVVFCASRLGLLVPALRLAPCFLLGWCGHGWVMRCEFSFEVKGMDALERKGLERVCARG